MNDLTQQVTAARACAIGILRSDGRRVMHGDTIEALAMMLRETHHVFIADACRLCFADLAVALDHAGRSARAADARLCASSLLRLTELMARARAADAQLGAA